MEKHQKRMKKEYKELLERIDKLDRFLDEHIDDLEGEEYRLMRTQYFAMCAYEGALRMRIERQHYLKRL